ncbi:MAG: serine/threonine-protein phosphatase [Anaerolineae bacterium]|nr:serine/threonine-protein phosphatase [Anaerolineae bacterium]
MIKIGSATNRGIKRKDSPNQDSVEVVMPSLFNRHPPLLIVADGMGGYEGGAIASKLVIESLKEWYLKAKLQVDYCDVLRQGVLAAHHAILEKSQQSEELAKMGSTVVAAVLQPRSLCLCNVGDSRAYIINAREIRQVSYDHSFVGEQLRLGLITAEEAQNHPRRNILTQSLSAQRGEINPYLTRIDLEQEDIVLLCSDGLWGPVPESQIQSIALELDPQSAADRLVEMANDNEGPDNISVIVARQ